MLPYYTLQTSVTNHVGIHTKNVHMSHEPPPFPTHKFENLITNHDLPCVHMANISHEMRRYEYTTCTHQSRTTALHVTQSGELSHELCRYEYTLCNMKSRTTTLHVHTLEISVTNYVGMRTKHAQMSHEPQPCKMSHVIYPPNLKSNFCGTVFCTHIYIVRD